MQGYKKAKFLSYIYTNKIKNMTIAQQLKIKEFPFEIRDSHGNYIYYENSRGNWFKHEYDAQGNQIYYETSTGYWHKVEYDADGRNIYFENSAGHWSKREYDAQGKEIYYENSRGEVIDKRPKIEITMDEIAAKFGIPVEQLKIKK